MRMTNYLLPVLKEMPSDAQIASHGLMLRAGMIQQSAAGIYSWLPLGIRVLRKIEALIREEQDQAGVQEILMPTVQPVDLWRESGRYEDYGKEMLRIRDRHDREMLYGPTNEELVTDIFRTHVRSYRSLPLMLYQIQWKFRDEVRPRFGLMRGREFLMKDAYSFDWDIAAARRAYNKMFVCYLRTFASMGLQAIPMRAETGPIGGELSHEFIILADTGESDIYCHRDWLTVNFLEQEVDYDADLQPLVDHWTGLYAATDGMHNLAQEKVLGDALVHRRGIEVGHIFHFGTKYSEPMGAIVQGPGGETRPVAMGSYGIGVSRCVAAIIEAFHDDDGIIWPEAVAPFRVGLLNLETGDTACDRTCEEIYDSLARAGVDVLYDERNERAGDKFATMDLLGLPWQVVVGPRGLRNGVVELKCRSTGRREELTREAVLSRLTA